MVVIIKFGRNKKEVTQEWTKLRNENAVIYTLHDIEPIIRIIKSIRMILAANVARIEQIRNTDTNLIGKP
jgi:hypothetical protein